jgi:hypothetical protein
MIVIHSTEVSILYLHVVISSLIGQLENLLFATLYTSFGVWSRDHYMPLQRSTLVHMSCFAIGFPFLGTTEYPQAPFAIAKVSPPKPLLHLAVL